MMKAKILFLLIQFSLICLNLQAQSTVKITSSVDTIDFGETADILIEVRQPDKTKQYLSYDFSVIRNELHDRDTSFFEPFADVFVGFEDKNLYPFYNVEEKKLDIQLSSYNNKANILIPAKIKFLSYGDFVIHAPKYQDNNGNITPLVADEIKIFVKIPPGMEEIESVDVSEIKPIVEVYESFWSKFGKYIIGIALLALLLYLFKKYRDKLRNRPAAVQEIIEEKPDPYLVAIGKLESFNKEKPWLTGDVKEYQTALTSTVRNYIEGRYGINAMEMTTSEIMDQLQNKPLETELKYDLSDILQVADLVKFAKAKPSSDVHQDFLDKAIHFVVKTRKFPAS